MDKIGIFGAGSIGCYVGGVLALHGFNPILVGRESMARRLFYGFEITDYGGNSEFVAANRYHFSGEAADLEKCDAVIVCVKSGSTMAAARTLAGVLRPGALVVSFQNGVSNADFLRRELTPRTVLAGMVGFNIAQIGERRFHRGSAGEIIVEGHPDAGPFVQPLRAAGLDCRMSGDIAAVLWGKLLLNLNNSVNALSGLPLKLQLSRRQYRRILAAAMREALEVLAAANIRPARIGRIGPRLIPAVLELPDRLFSFLATGMLKIDADARSSMAEDLERGREPEIDWLNGEIVRLGLEHGVPTPVNRRLVELVKEFAHAGKPAKLDADALLRETGLTGSALRR